MSEIRILSPEDFDAVAQIFADAYPGLGIVSSEDRERFKQRALKLHEQEPAAHFHGLFRGNKLLGIMCLYELQMNFLQTQIPAAGIGQVAVALPHKKEHVAKEMMSYCLYYYRERDVPLVALYPFRPDFYRRMGFGYGSKIHQYRLRPAALPRGPSKARVRYLVWDDRQAASACYHRFADRTHGMMQKSERELKRLFQNPKHRLVGYQEGNQIKGYLAFTFESDPDSFIVNDIHIQEFIYETQEALSQLLTFLHTQADQIRYVFINTQDEYFHHLLLDPRNDSGRLIPDVYHETNAQGLGLMVRIIDVPAMFGRLGERNYGGQTCTLKLTVADSFLPENAGSTLLRFENGVVQQLDGGDYDVEARLDIADFSSLLAGTVDFHSLYRYGLVDLSEPDYVEPLNRLFAVEQKPMCITSF